MLCKVYRWSSAWSIVVFTAYAKIVVAVTVVNIERYKYCGIRLVTAVLLKRLVQYLLGPIILFDGY